MYVLALAIVAAVSIKALDGATQRSEEGQTSGFYDHTRPEPVQRLEADLRAGLQTKSP